MKKILTCLYSISALMMNLLSVLFELFYQYYRFFKWSFTIVGVSRFQSLITGNACDNATIIRSASVLNKKLLHFIIIILCSYSHKFLRICYLFFLSSFLWVHCYLLQGPSSLYMRKRPFVSLPFCCAQFLASNILHKLKICLSRKIFLTGALN